MACTSPHVILVSKFLNKDGKHNVRMVSPLEFLNFDGGFDAFKKSYEANTEYNVSLVPCGQCLSCRLDYSREWSVRCFLEALYHNKNCFITLTYNDDNLPQPVDDITPDGQVVSQSHVSKRDFQLFMKRLRKKLGCKVRFFASGEYSPNGRPHYHAILFGVDFDDKKYFKRNFQGDIIFVSDTLSELWPYGFSTVADFSINTASYVARYCIKKFKSSDNSSDEFCLMSRRPGLGYNYFCEHIFNDLYDGYITLPNGGRASIPKYYDYLVNSLDFDKLIDLETIKLNRSINCNNFNLNEIFKHSLGSLENLLIQKNKKAELSAFQLKRKEVK